LSSATTGEGVFRCGGPHLWCLRTVEIYGISARTKGVEPVRTFFEQGGGGQFFAILCGRTLWTAPNQICPDVITFAQISPQFCPNFVEI